MRLPMRCGVSPRALEKKVSDPFTVNAVRGESEGA